MKLKHRKIFFIGLFVLAVIIILLVLFNSLLYPYKNILKLNLNNYYKTGEQVNIDNINKLITRYKNNENRLNNINSLVASNIDSWINDYNDNYEDVTSLDNKKSLVVERINNLFDYLDETLNVITEKDKYLTEINNLYLSKTNYLKAIDYLNAEDYSKAYDYLEQVDDSDSFYDSTMEKIDLCIESTLNKIVNKVTDLDSIDENTSEDDKLKVYESIYSYLSSEKENTKIDLSKSKTYTDLINEYVNDLINEYVLIAKSYAEENNYQDAVDLINQGIKLLSNGDYNVVSLTDLVSAYQLMLPISLTTLNGNKTGEWIKEATGLIDISNNAYVRGLEFLIGPSKSYNKNIITYNINGEYKYLKGTLANARGINTKEKCNVTIKILGDDKVLGNYKITGSSSKIDIDLDVNKVNNLSIEYTIDYNNVKITENYVNILLGNPLLEKY